MPRTRNATVPKGRFELPRGYPHYALNVARLPVPPLRLARHRWLFQRSRPPDSNRRPAVYETAALPTELGRRPNHRDEPNNFSRPAQPGTTPLTRLDRELHPASDRHRHRLHVRSLSYHRLIVRQIVGNDVIRQHQTP